MVRALIGSATQNNDGPRLTSGQESYKGQVASDKNTVRDKLRSKDQSSPNQGFQGMVPSERAGPGTCPFEYPSSAAHCRSIVLAGDSHSL